MTTVYLLRHSKPLQVNNELNSDNLQVQNEKRCLSVEGEKFAKEKLNNKELKSIDVLYASNYVRAIGTANNIAINIVSNLGERKHGIDSWDELPEGFERKQFLDENYKIGNGESQKEVRNRMYSAIMSIINENDNKRIAIVSHGTAISYLLKKWCDLSIVNDKIRYSYKDKILLDGYLDYCVIFKLEFDENNLVDINIIK